jgi:hypothetical protein
MVNGNGRVYGLRTRAPRLRLLLIVIRRKKKTKDEEKKTFHTVQVCGRLSAVGIVEIFGGGEAAGC